MIVSITCIRLKSPLKIPRLIRLSSRIFQQLQSTNCMSVQTRGVWKDHYTMTTWSDRKAMRNFAMSGEHKAAMAESKALSTEVITVSLELEKKPSWKEAKALLKKEGKVYRFN